MLPLLTDKTVLKIKIVKLYPVLVFLMISLIIASLVEFFRGSLMLEIGSKSTHLFHWYFGSLNMRLESKFWITMLERFNHWQPPFFFWIYIGVTTVSIFIVSEAKNRYTVIASALSFFIAWLTFANLYVIHSYYQFPVVFIIFIAFAVSCSVVLDSIILKVSKIYGDSLPHTITVYAITVVMLGQFMTHKSLSVKQRSVFWNAVEYCLQSETKFLVAGFNLKNPSVGGVVSTKFDTVLIKEFEQNCQKYLNQYSAFLIRSGQSSCAESVKMKATHYIQETNRIFFKIDPSLNTLAKKP
jgi:hypothetical protein